jgi:itaconate CoA-transferase
VCAPASVLQSAGRHRAVHIDGRSRRRATQIEAPEIGDNSGGSTRPAGSAKHLFRDQQSRRDEPHPEPEDRREPRNPAQSVATADIFGKNFRPGAAEKNGFGDDDLRKVNPRPVYISVSGYGPKEPDGELPGTDSMAQVLAGVVEASSSPTRPA